VIVTVDKHQHFISFISATTSIRLEHSFSNAEKQFVSNLKIDDSLVKLGYDVFSFGVTFGSSARQNSIA